MVTAAWVRNTVLFSGLDEFQIDVILSHSSIEFFPEGKNIFSQGDDAYRLYILIEGVVTLTVKTGERIDFMASTIDKEGAAFGMPCLLEPFRNNVTATALKPSKVLIIEATPVREKMEEDPEMGMEIMKKLALIYFNRLNEMREGVSKFLRGFKDKIP